MDAAVTKTPTISGTPYAGGFYVGRYQIDGQLFALIVANKAEGELPGQWNSTLDTVNGAASYNNGLTNTNAMAEAGSDLAKAALALRINNLDDWFIPARDELELCYRYLKPSTYADNMWRAGDNPSSVPPGYPYTEQSPAQTINEAFQKDGAEAFDIAWYWASTQNANGSDYAWMQTFSDGTQHDRHKSYEGRARAVRRTLVIE
ncbi:hypothetical protein [Undibacterium sp. Ji22W]|uniref:hypothetical protein n=1 Tax=Undibacterium sp. Ji22W TaxID=3413038 RepID=UPI003BF14931